jgi:3D-(3,5/4)-trihydroxycyclohexane-1,2-dione acylhydrolase (decyclizing)
MLHTELVTAVAENIKLIVVLVQNQGYASIGHLSETVGSQRFGTGQPLPLDLAANARSYGVRVFDVPVGQNAVAELADAVSRAKASDGPTLIHIHSDPLLYGPDGEGWWDVPVAAVSTVGSTTAARADYDAQRESQRPLLG